MFKLIGLALAVGLAVLIIQNLPDIQRYLRMRTM